QLHRPANNNRVHTYKNPLECAAGLPATPLFGNSARLIRRPCARSCRHAARDAFHSATSPVSNGVAISAVRNTKLVEFCNTHPHGRPCKAGFSTAVPAHNSIVLQ